MSLGFLPIYSNTRCFYAIVTKRQIYHQCSVFFSHLFSTSFTLVDIFMVFSGGIIHPRSLIAKQVGNCRKISPISVYTEKLSPGPHYNCHCNRLLIFLWLWRWGAPFLVYSWNRLGIYTLISLCSNLQMFADNGEAHPMPPILPSPTGWYKTRLSASPASLSWEMP